MLLNVCSEKCRKHRFNKNNKNKEIKQPVGFLSGKNVMGLCQHVYCTAEGKNGNPKVQVYEYSSLRWQYVRYSKTVNRSVIHKPFFRILRLVSYK